jgi:aromatic-L-amino-acid/L-tryptophan decarboxylase
MDNASRSPFDPPLDELKRLGAEAVDFASRFVDQRYEAPSSDYSELESLLPKLAEAPPRQPRDLKELLADIESAAAKGFDTANPGFVAYIPGGGLYASALADFIACVVNRYTGISAPAPALVQMEASVLRWFCDLFDLGPEAQGVLTPGGSMSNLSAIVTARTALLGDDFRQGRIYASEEIHHSIVKAARFAGFPEEAIHFVPTDDALHMDVTELEQAIDADRARGLQPFLVVASAGTINTGVVDPMHEVARVANEKDLWFHVDAAYGGFFQLTERGRESLRGIELADSITLDPHKGLFLPYGTGCLLAKDGKLLRAAHEVHAHYLPQLSDDPGLPDFSSYSPELTRDFRGLRLWLPLHLYGTDAFVRALDEKLDLARYVAAELKQLEELTVKDPELSLVAFRPKGDDAAAEQLLDRINAVGRVWLSSSPVRGEIYLRICILSHRSHPQRIREAVEIIRSLTGSSVSTR